MCFVRFQDPISSESVDKGRRGKKRRSADVGRDRRGFPQSTGAKEEEMCCHFLGFFGIYFLKRMLLGFWLGIAKNWLLSLCYFKQ